MGGGLYGSIREKLRFAQRGPPEAASGVKADA
jgi:hypothetical protein